MIKLLENNVEGITEMSQIKFNRTTNREGTRESVFKRILHSVHLDKANKDTLTGLKNRDAYELDLNEIIIHENIEGMGIVSIDINGLDPVTKRLGTQAGDDYVELVADYIQDNLSDHMVAYRFGNDEFAVLVPHATEQILQDFITLSSKSIKSQARHHNMRCSVSCGYGIYDDGVDKNFQDTYSRAEEAKCLERQRQKSNGER